MSNDLKMVLEKIEAIFTLHDILMECRDKWVLGGVQKLKQSLALTLQIANRILILMGSFLRETIILEKYRVEN